MESREFRKNLVSGFDIEQEGKSLYIKGATFLPTTVDYTDNNAVKIIATNAKNTANGIYDLIKVNCNTSAPDVSSKAHLEMYISFAGLACEIYMKSIIYNENLHNGRVYKGHKLDEIFNIIPEVHKNTIRRKIQDIDVILPTVNDAFESLRYDFELNHIQGNYLVLFELMDELKKICNNYPESKSGSIRYANGVLGIE